MKKYLKITFVMAGLAVAVICNVKPVNAQSTNKASFGGSCIGDRNYDCGETSSGTKLYGTWTEQQTS
jgi:hypothetical protein